MNELMNEYLTTPQHKNKSAIVCQTNDIYIKSKKSNVHELKIHMLDPNWAFMSFTVYNLTFI